MTTQPLDPHTLRFVDDIIGQQLNDWHEIRRTIDESEHPTIDALIAELNNTRAKVRALLSTTSDRARVVVLPEADDDDSLDIRYYGSGVHTVNGDQTVYVYGPEAEAHPMTDAEDFALLLLAAHHDAAGGAK